MNFRECFYTHPQTPWPVWAAWGYWANLKEKGGNPGGEPESDVAGRRDENETHDCITGVVKAMFFCAACRPDWQGSEQS